MAVWLLEDATSSPAAPAYAGVADVGHDQVVMWTQDAREALRFPGVDEARQFARQHVTRTVRIAEHEFAYA